MNDEDKYLITTRIEEVWPKNSSSRIFFHSIEPLDCYPKSDFQYKKFDIIDNYWKNDDKLLEKFQYLDSLYEKSLKGFSDYLNNLHNTNHQTKFWRILLGPWLIIYIFMSFDKWKKIENAISKFSINKAKKIDFNRKLLVPYELSDFINFTKNDLWNQMLNQDIFQEFLSPENIEKVEFNNIDRLNEELRVNRQGGITDSLIKKILLKFLSLKNNANYKYLIYKPYIGAIKELILSIKVKQLPIYKIDKKKFEKKGDINSKKRENMRDIFKSENNFENYLLNSFKHNVPRIFIENFDDLKDFYKNANLPKKPEKIFSSNGLWYDSFFSYYTALKNEKGTKVIYGQHGGSYGIAKYSWQENHEKKISDKYLTWGWSDQSKENQVKNFHILIRQKKYNWEKNKKNLLVLLKHRKIYLQAPDTFATCEPHSEYLNFLRPFLISLDQTIQKNMVLRLTYKNFNDNNFDFFSNFSKKFNFDRSETLEQACDKSKLIINTCNSTTFLETIASNIPSILVLNKNNNPIRYSAIEYFEDLFKNNLIFYDSLKASTFVNSLWSTDIREWWENPKLQNIIKSFQEKFANPADDLILKIRNEIEN